ncbi:exo-beta-N-acetylmuramidase NamZ family protein [Salinifilum aidingensis]
MDVNRRHFVTTAALAPALLPAASGASGTASAGAGPVRTGADVLAAQHWRPLRGNRVGVLTNPTGVLSSLQHVVDAMHEQDVPVVAAFGPEHGFRGTGQAGESEGDARDPRTGLPVYDTYGSDADAMARMLREARVEHLVFDIADVGARFYTYIWTMYTAMRAASRVGAAFTVLDRPNPIGDRVAGPLLDPAFSSGVGLLPIAQQHGMTAGELALLFDREHLPRRLDRLEVVRVTGWHGRTADTGLPWVPPSPNMPARSTAAVYPGTGLFEGTLLSEGRGTTTPFELVGAPGIDWRWAEELNAAAPPGVRFQEAFFAPAFSKHADRTCGGVRVHHEGEPPAVDAAVAMLVTARRLYPDVFGWRPDLMIDLLAGTDRLRRMIDAGADAAEVVGSWREEERRFRDQRRPHLLYD